jgi:hypothetical protein
MKSFRVLMLFAMLLSLTLSFGQGTLTDTQVGDAVMRGFTAGKRHQVGLTLNDKQTALLSGIACTTCKTSGYTIAVYTPESWIELQAVQARREMMPFSASSVTPEMRLPYIHVFALPSTAEYLNANGMGMASSVHRVVLSSTDRTDVVQPLSESRSTIETNSALRSFTQASAGAVFSLEDVDRLRSKDQKGEFFIVVVGDKQNKYFKVKAKFFNQLFGRDFDIRSEGEGALPPPVMPKASETPVIARASRPLVPAKAPEPPGVFTNSAQATSATPVNVSGGTATVSSPSQNGAALLGLAVTDWDQGGAKIVEVAPDSAAYVAGLHVGDVIDSVDGKRIRSVPDFTAALGNRAPDSKVRLGYRVHTSALGWIQGIDKVLTLHE